MGDNNVSTSGGGGGDGSNISVRNLPLCRPSVLAVFTSRKAQTLGLTKLLEMTKLLALTQFVLLTQVAAQTCNNLCSGSLVNDGECDDGGAGAEFSFCTWGTDCADCGTRTGVSPVDQNCGVIFTGSCGAFAKKSGKWVLGGQFCCANNENQCCEADPGPISGVSIGILVAIGLCITGCCMCPGCPLSRTLAKRQARQGAATAGVQVAGGLATAPVPTPVMVNTPAAVVVVATQQMDVVVPAGVTAGQSFTVATAAGTMQMTVPAGCGPGSTLRIDVPQQAAAEVTMQSMEKV